MIFIFQILQYLSSTKLTLNEQLLVLVKLLKVFIIFKSNRFYISLLINEHDILIIYNRNAFNTIYLVCAKWVHSYFLFVRKCRPNRLYLILMKLIRLSIDHRFYYYTFIKTWKTLTFIPSTFTVGSLIRSLFDTMNTLLHALLKS